jgi:Domain of unknown function (DUF4920)
MKFACKHANTILVALCLAGTSLFALPGYALDEKMSVVKRGETMSALPSKTVEMCIQESSGLAGKKVKITGKVKQVCQTKGCWFVIENKNGQSVRVTSLGYKFFVPTNAAGKTATVEGVFGVKELSAEMAQHYENDRVAGSTSQPQKITASVKEYSIAATSVELK